MTTVLGVFIGLILPPIVFDVVEYFEQHRVTSPMDCIEASKMCALVLGCVGLGIDISLAYSSLR
jgi:hypothetical protein